MTGEMSQSEVTRDAYPDLFALRDALHRRGIPSEPHAFDQYQGPNLRVGPVTVWYSAHPEVYRNGDELRGVVPFVIEASKGFLWHGAHHAHAETADAQRHGCYTLRQAARRIESCVGRPVKP